MFDSEWLDIAISVVMIWFLLALVVSTINEGVVRVLAIRSKQLWKALGQLLEGTDPPAGVLRNLKSLPTWHGRPASPTAGANASLTAKLYATKTIQGLEPRTEAHQKTRIDNIPPPIFAHALLEMASPHGAQPMARIRAYINALPAAGPLKPQLETVLATANGDVNQFRAGVERWFAGQMKRLTAIYRAQIRVILIAIGLGVAIGGFAVGLRTDSLRLISDLQHDRNLRTLVVGAATETAHKDLAKEGCQASSPTTATTTVATKPGTAGCELAGVQKLKSVDLSFHDPAPPATGSLGNRLGFLLPWRHWHATVGVLITAIAISFGSTFWYDALKRLVGVRGGAQAAAAG